jgi:hypothetical protein
MSTPEQNSEPSNVGEKPEWYSKGEIFDWLKRNDYSDTIANELSGKISHLLNGLRKRIDQLIDKELRADRMVVDLEHDKDVLKAKIRELEKYNKYQADKWKELEADRDNLQKENDYLIKTLSSLMEIKKHEIE